MGEFWLKEKGMFLSNIEVQELTGLKYHKSQIKWLMKQGYKFDVAVSGAPKILKAFVEERLGMTGNRAKRQETLNFSNSKYFG